MQKNKNKNLKSILLGLGVMATAAVPIITTISCGQDTSPNPSDTNEGGSYMDPVYGTDYEGLVAANLETDGDSWNPNYRYITRSNAALSFENARQEGIGWRSELEYVEYLIHRNEVGNSRNTIFGKPGQMNGNNWTGFYFQKPPWSPGNTDSQSIIKWQGAETKPWNSEMDGSLKWTAHDGGNGTNFFVWDENNTDNAWERFNYMKIISPVSASDIEADAGKNTDGAEITRNKFMVNGVLVDTLPANKNFFYVTDTGKTDDESDYIRDDNGWKVIITDENKDNIFTKIINPANITNKTTPSSDADIAEAFSEIYKIKDDIADAEHIDYSNYNVNETNKIENTLEAWKKNDDGVAKQKSYYSGKYTLGLQRDTFGELTAEPNLVFPAEGWQPGFDQDPNWVDYSQVPNRYGYVGLSNQLSATTGSARDTNFAWAENGKGGYKIWKNYEIAEKVLQWRRGEMPTSPPHNKATFDLPDEFEPGSSSDDVVFYGNWNVLYPVLEPFKNAPQFYDDKGF